MKKYRIYIIIGVVAVVAIGGYLWYCNVYKKKKLDVTPIKDSKASDKPTGSIESSGLGSVLPDSLKQKYDEGKEVVLNAK